MIADATLTEILARIFGLYMLAAGTGLALNGADLPKMLEEMRQSRLAFYLGGLIAFAIGAATVSLHNDFSGPLAIFITLFGWVALAEGVIMLAFPKAMRTFAGKFVAMTGTARIWGAGVAAFGVVLLIAGFA
jgi:uncharacterized protein YjeT (DUF2065 family)